MLGTGHSNPVVHSGMGTREVPQGTPVDRVGAAVGRTSVVLEPVVGSGTFVERCFAAALMPGEQYNVPGWAV